VAVPVAVRGAAGATPRRISPPATGTAPHSQPGSKAPASPATGTAVAERLGSARVKNDDGTKAAMLALITTPSTRNGMAWTQIAVKIVAQV